MAVALGTIKQNMTLMPDKSNTTIKIRLCKIQDIPTNSGKGFLLNNNKIFVVSKNNAFYGYVNNCPHANIPLDWDNDNFLDADHDLIQCSTHGALFLIESGECVSGPCSGQSLQPIKLHLEQDAIVVFL